VHLAARTGEGIGSNEAKCLIAGDQRVRIDAGDVDPVSFAFAEVKDDVLAGRPQFAEGGAGENELVGAGPCALPISLVGPE
jgi:hypothetical protein